MNAFATISSSAVAAAGSSYAPTSLNVAGTAAETGATPFTNLLSESISQINQIESQARTAIDGLMTGKGVDVHQATIAAQKASMSFELALSVRNKAVQAYQSVMGMQF
jgi:flagellar hook-basal body complex protein FliE